MSIQNLLQRYSLDVRARGGSEDTIQHTAMVLKFFTDFMGGIDDVTELVDDDIDTLMRESRDNMDKKRAAGRFSKLLVVVSRDNYRQFNSLSW